MERTGFADHVSQHRTGSPRNPWARVALATELLAVGDADAAQAQLERLSLQERVPPELLARLRRETAIRKSPDERVGLVNAPPDYLALPHERALHGFRRLNAVTHVVPRFPRGMPLPAIHGAGNDTDFLLDASTCRAAASGLRARRVHAVISNATVEEAQRLVARLAGQMGRRPLSATIFLAAGDGEFRPLPQVPVDVVRRPMLDPLAAAQLGALAERGDDILLFLEGGVELDDSVVARAAFLGDTTDNLVQVLRGATRSDALRTCFSRVAAEDLRKDPMPYAHIDGFNFAVPARLLRRAGRLESRFGTSGLAARELGYRFHLSGGYFHALPVPRSPDPATARRRRATPRCSTHSARAPAFRGREKRSSARA